MTIIKTPATFIVVCLVFIIIAYNNKSDNYPYLKYYVRIALYFISNKIQSSTLKHLLTSNKLKTVSYALITLDNSSKIRKFRKPHTHLFFKQLLSVRTIKFNKKTYFTDMGKIALECAHLKFLFRYLNKQTEALAKEISIKNIAILSYELYNNNKLICSHKNTSGIFLKHQKSLYNNSIFDNDIKEIVKVHTVYQSYSPQTG